MKHNNLLSTAQTAKLLKISAASIKNWEKHGLLAGQNGSYPESEVLALRKKIRSGEINRLNRRANKKYAGGLISPAGDLGAVCTELLQLNLPPAELMFLVSFRLFISHNLSSAQPLCRLLDFQPEDYSSHAVLLHMRRRFEQLTAGVNELQTGFDAVMRLKLPPIFESSLPADNDISGRIYQAVSRRGDRAASGSFYTPPQLADKIIHSALAQLPPEISPRFIDPCCGTGQFMLSFIKAGGRAENAFGIDSDDTAAFTAGTNILLQCPDIESLPNIFCVDSLLASSSELPDFNLLVTNPPWGACTSGNRKMLEKRYPMIKSGESFSYFICRAFELVRTGGIVSVVLPESISNVKRHEDIRRHILKIGSINRINSHGKVFTGVYTPVITMEMTKTKDEPLSEIDAGYVLNDDFTFSININTEDIKIIDKLYSIPHISLKDGAQWALGIVTGDNDRYLIRTNKDNGSPVLPSGCEAVIRGSDIQPGRITPPQQFIRFDPDHFQQSAPEWKYRAEAKLVYRFISKRPVVALDRSGSLTLNSANVVIPDAGELSCREITLEDIVNQFNSDLYAFVYRKKFNSVKVLRSHLEQLPILKAETLLNYFSEKEMAYISAAIK